MKKIKIGDLITLKKKYKDGGVQNTGIVINDYFYDFVVDKYSNDFIQILFENGDLELKYSGHIYKFYKSV